MSLTEWAKRDSLEVMTRREKIGVFVTGPLLAAAVLVGVTLSSERVVQIPIDSPVLNKTSSEQLQDPVELKNELIALHNEERVKAGAEPLVENELLTTTANAKNAHMMENDYWSHAYLDEIFYTHVPSHILGSENLGITCTDAQCSHNGFMISPVHKEALLLPEYDAIGVSVVESDITLYPSGYSVVVHFADFVE